jgi:hypothetical protein
MFGRSTASRFQENKNYTPGPGEYDIKELKTTKKGFVSKTERKMEYQITSQFAHLGPGCYTAKEGSNQELKAPRSSFFSWLEFFLC